MDPRPPAPTVERPVDVAGIADAERRARIEETIAPLNGVAATSCQVAPWSFVEYSSPGDAPQST